MKIRIRKFALKIFMLFLINTFLASALVATTVYSLLGKARMVYIIIQSRIRKLSLFVLISVIILTFWNYIISSENDTNAIIACDILNRNPRYSITKVGV